MDGASILLVLAALGVSFGWQPDQDDPQAYEVTAQIEPELLDVLKSGRSVPIEAHVPAEVAPIRKVRIVVGEATLPRQTIAKAAKPAERVVRGQEPSPQPHTARYEESDPWTSDRYSAGATVPPPATRQFDQRGATIGANDIRTAQAPPSPWDRAQTAVNESSNALRDGVESGIRQANDQYQNLSNQLSTSANNTSQAIGQQYRNLTDNAASSQSGSWPAPPPTVSSATPASQFPGSAPAVSAPPPMSGAPVSRTAATTTNPWSSIRPELAPPRLMNPPLAPLSTAGAGTRVASNPSGPTIPSLESPPLHSVLADPAANRNLPAPPTSSQPNWASGWGSANGTQATIGNAGGNPQSPWGTAATNTAPPAATNSQPRTGLWDDFPPPHPSTTPAATTPQPEPRYTTQLPANSQPAANTPPPMIGTASPILATTQAANTAPTGEQLPWIPLLVVSVSLAGSLGANLFLGWSYADARYRYRNLVRKTTNSFHRATGAAA